MRRIPRRRGAARCPKPGRSRRVAGLVVATVALLGLGSASAARLDVLGTSLAAGTGTVTSCQGGAPLTAQLVSEGTSGGFTTTQVTVSGVAADCVGKHFRLSVVGSGSAAQLREVTGQVTATSFTTDAFAPVTTSTIDRVEVVIHS